MAEPSDAAEFGKGLPEHYRIDDGKAFTLADMPTAERGDLDKATGKALIRARRERLATLQERLAAGRTRGVLVVLQGMDTSGKDSLIRHVMSGLNPQGTRVTSFKAPSAIEQEHDFLWRIHAAVPERGQIGIFNRSHYEDVLIARVHADKLSSEGLEGDPHRPEFWDDRLQDIRHFERYLTRQGIIIVKFFLHISPDEQRQRLLRRLSRPQKRWKFDESDIAERAFWPAYADAYEQAIRGTARAEAPWFVVPSDHKWFSRLVVMEALIATLEAIGPEPPPPSDAVERHVEQLSKRLRGDHV
ncbi:hypothetical protein AA101099_2104 [Neoasaia chiangmaiensis NBRC 101099]|uniref:Polyphosphate--nucleotide phosphotransferase n=1 Tax=Neoasaia chiangmaiensis TaxID=320497 RepID=A0A1U9KT41_9PROT|nr:PPK2 family polyphosphate kinase [Neoasaia chiangmaiensis]AQS88912.1 polyphosphate--nucleotide phosphotransferase [Neoasaia chiangmaiensis]GBR40420.1 hypothetical protein AA101099_2104 [Neoasaia chiangmaiensis NBRC 101099]GEN13908.1 hypothetical protein NCH01_03390 [Neoasaia chiangmaiensis]